MIAIALSGCDFVSQVNSEIGFKDEKKPVVDEAPPVTTAQKQDSRNLWWQNATSLGPRSKGGDDPMVQCQVGGSTRFTRKRACRAAGGSILD